MTATRPTNIISAAEKRGSLIADSLVEVQSERFEHEAESRLYETLQRLTPEVEAAQSQCEFTTLYQLLSVLDEPVNRLFDHVMVMCQNEGIRQNRLNLLACANRLYRALADFTQIVTE